MKKQCKQKCCDDSCDDFCYIGEGDTVCMKSTPPKLIFDDWIPTENFAWCLNGQNQPKKETAGRCELRGGKIQIKKGK